MLTTLICGGSLLAAEQKFTPAERRAKSINSAKVIATRNVMETISRQHFVYVVKMHGLDASSFDTKIDSHVLASKIRGMRYSTECDQKRDLAIVHIEVEFDDIVDLVPAWKNSSTRLYAVLVLLHVLQACEKVKSKSNKPPQPVPQQMEFCF